MDTEKLTLDVGSRQDVQHDDRPTLREVARARPRRGTGAPARCASHKEHICQLLRERGPLGVVGSELYSRPDLYGRSPRNRISELRKDGHLIEGKPHGSSDWFYRLIRDNAGVEPSPRHPWKNAFSPNRLAQDDCFALTPPEPRK